MTEQAVNGVLDDEAVESLSQLAQGDDPRKLSVESLALITATQGVKKLEDKMKTEFMELKERQGQVRLMHQLQKQINANSTDGEGFDWSENEELQALINEVRELGVAIPGEEDNFVFTEEDKRALMDNLKMTVDDLQILNDLQLQKISSLTNRRYEFYQMARSILRPLHEDKINKARKIT